VNALLVPDEKCRKQENKSLFKTRISKIGMNSEL
jgi:hypothetical protein